MKSCGYRDYDSYNSYLRFQSWCLRMIGRVRATSDVPDAMRDGVRSIWVQKAFSDNIFDECEVDNMLLFAELCDCFLTVDNGAPSR